MQSDKKPNQNNTAGPPTNRMDLYYLHFPQFFFSDSAFVAKREKGNTVKSQVCFHLNQAIWGCEVE